MRYMCIAVPANVDEIPLKFTLRDPETVEVDVVIGPLSESHVVARDFLRRAVLERLLEIYGEALEGSRGTGVFFHKLQGRAKYLLEELDRWKS